MNKEKTRKDNNYFLIINILIVFYVFFNYIFTKTTLTNEKYLSFFTLFIFLNTMYLFLKVIYRKKAYKLESLLWIPFLFYMVIGNIINHFYNRAFLWAICLFIITIAYDKKFRIPYRTLFFIGIFFSLGIFFQYFCKEMYNARVFKYFLNDVQKDIIHFESYNAYAGFSYQLDTTAVPILYTIGILLYKSKLNKFIKLIIYVYFSISIFFTNKRSFFILAIIVPIIIYLIEKKGFCKKIKYILTFLLLMSIIIYFFIKNIDVIRDLPGINKIILTYEHIKKSQDFTSGRENLYKIAIKAFKQYPFFGIGVSLFITKTGAYTDVHSSYLQVLTEMGIVGEIFFLMPIIYCFYKTVLNLKSLKYLNCDNLKFSLFIQIIFILYGFVGNPTINIYGYIMYFFSIGILINDEIKRRDIYCLKNL